mmetsp:Transcript_52356/g.103346  ORF Transcript_52356/g.103346 Transcript_52356/m.103346 type:complete len:213 (-) Transcript_52356:51-689(-)
MRLLDRALDNAHPAGARISPKEAEAAVADARDVKRRAFSVQSHHQRGCCAESGRVREACFEGPGNDGAGASALRRGFHRIARALHELLGEVPRIQPEPPAPLADAVGDAHGRSVVRNKPTVLAAVLNLVRVRDLGHTSMQSERRALLGSRGGRADVVAKVPGGPRGRPLRDERRRLGPGKRPHVRAVLRQRAAGCNLLHKGHVRATVASRSR